MHLLNAFGLRRVRGGPKEIIKALFKIGCPWFKHWSEKTKVSHPDGFGRPIAVDCQIRSTGVQFSDPEVFPYLALDESCSYFSDFLVA